MSCEHVWDCIVMDSNDALYRCRKCGWFSDGDHDHVWKIAKEYQSKPPEMAGSDAAARIRMLEDKVARMDARLKTLEPLKWEAPKRETCDHNWVQAAMTEDVRLVCSKCGKAKWWSAN